jgi:signal transduction histidine kinase
MENLFRLPFSMVRRSTTPYLDAYMVVVALVGLGASLTLLPRALSDLGDVDVSFWVLAACVLPAEVIRIPVWRRGVVNQITMSRPFALALLTGWGAPLAVLVFVLASIASDLIYKKPTLRIPFNAGQYALSIAASGAVYHQLGGKPSLGLEQVPAFIAAVLVLMVVNRLLVRIAVALYERKQITFPYLLSEAQVELVEGAVQFSMVLVALLVAQRQLVLPALLALPALPIYVAGRTAARAEELARDYAEELLHYRHLFVVANRYRRQADAPGGATRLQAAEVALDLRTSTSMLKSVLSTIASEAERQGLSLVHDLASNGIEHADQLTGKLAQFQQPYDATRAAAHVRERLDATELVRVAEQLARTVCPGRPVSVAAPATPLFVLANHDEVLDILGNLVRKAHRFAPPQTAIRLAIGVESGKVVLAVEDDGVDVTPEQRERIFDEEVQRDIGPLPGAGLAHGVAIARQLARANGGELRPVDPDGADGRARFELSLPLAADIDSHHDPRTAQPESLPGGHTP